MLDVVNLKWVEQTRCWYIIIHLNEIKKKNEILYAGTNTHFISKRHAANSKSSSNS